MESLYVAVHLMQLKRITTSSGAMQMGCECSVCVTVPLIVIADRAEASAKDANVVARNAEQLGRLLDDAEAQLAAGGPFLAGGGYSAADVMLTPLLFRVSMAGHLNQALQPRPHLQEYYAR
jgi:glutathione S-transferase